MQEDNVTATSIAYFLHYIASTVERQSDQILQEQLGISFAQYKVLWVLQVHPNVLQKELASSLAQTEASITRQIQLLRNKGLITTTRNERNRREHITVVTTKGNQIVEVALKLLARQYDQTLSSLDEKAKQTLIESLSVLHRDNFPDQLLYSHLWGNMI